MNDGLLAAPALAATLSAAAIWMLRRAASALPADIPNSRSLHALPVPRAGGYAVWLGFLPAAVLFPPAYPGGWLGWLPAWAALAAVSAADDKATVLALLANARGASASLAKYRPCSLIEFP